MDFKKLDEKIVGLGAPLLGAALGAGAAGVLTDIQARHAERLEELALDRARIEAEERISVLRQVNQTMRAAAGDTSTVPLGQLLGAIKN